MFEGLVRNASGYAHELGKLRNYYYYYHWGIIIIIIVVAPG